jgi:predicted RNase H-like HicB family nuclease
MTTTKSHNQTTKAESRDLDYFLSLSYPIEIHEDEDGVTALYPDLPGCVSHGETIDDAVKRLKITKKLWMDGRSEAGYEIPLPAEMEEFSGKTLLRMPKDLHCCLHSEAERQGTSLNQYLVYLLSKRHQVQALDIDKLLSSLNAGICRMVFDQKLFYMHGGWPTNRTFRFEGVHGGLEHLEYLAKPAGLLDDLEVRNAPWGKSSYEDKHFFEHTAWEQR